MAKNNTLFALTVFSLLSWASMVQGGIQTADFQLTCPANPASGAFFFSFSDGKLEWKTVLPGSLWIPGDEGLVCLLFSLCEQTLPLGLIIQIGESRRGGVGEDIPASVIFP